MHAHKLYESSRACLYVGRRTLPYMASLHLLLHIEMTESGMVCPVISGPPPSLPPHRTTHVVIIMSFTRTLAAFHDLPNFIYIYIFYFFACSLTVRRKLTVAFLIADLRKSVLIQKKLQAHIQ